MYEECCGTCQHHKNVDIGVLKPKKVWLCDNEYSINHGYETEYTDKCEDFEER